MEPKERTYFDSFRSVVKAIGSTLDFQKVMDILVSNMTEVMALKACAIRLLYPKKRTLELLASCGLSENYISKGPVDADRSLADALAGNTVIIHDARVDTRAQYRDAAAKEGIATIVSIPLSLKGRVIGVLRLYTGDPREFSREDLDFAESLAEVGAIAIENARMYQRIKKDYESVMDDIHNFVGYRKMD